MRIRTQETCTRYETWEYELPDDFVFPEDFFTWSRIEKYDYLQSLPFPYEAQMVDSDWTGNGTVDEIDIIG